MKIGTKEINDFNELKNTKIGETILINKIKLKVIEDKDEYCNKECYFNKIILEKKRSDCVKYCFYKYRTDNISVSYIEVK